ncbi:ankyrin repeat domain-containing protein 26-like isoform X1 [Canis lupus familiaris]|uniref:ankyrin repeat domain-containing protein 26-like isoform X1 n=1 Tax=Canis lupus familiaris TaxID=9615 RepID=UPI0018F37FBD|nr:ankyrin repeat domain-containing protein 26-like isoform X1 [Canis lupus familiaris]
MRMSLTKKLSKTNERLADISTKYLVERQQNRPFHSTLTMGPVLEGPSVGNLTSSLLLDRNVTPRENVMIPTSRPQTSVSSIETHLFKMQQMLEDSILRELKEVAAQACVTTYSGKRLPFLHILTNICHFLICSF